MGCTRPLVGVAVVTVVAALAATAAALGPGHPAGVADGAPTPGPGRAARRRPASRVSNRAW